ncbi:restriction endonuclease subunit R [Helicobacter didelphidarum]|uniref:Restriction endonuclease subunit R n=1 Tax=Helicobacter didelphidarum TaxID=2040648 RepID=A0A3D8IIW7_9HELI|nr:DEAD/DEAH box helicase family protein [Helicobacter didelphidarum]RDU65277.1 restriction endonuclease subunit R [Helicobacter didelphidarum]
MTEEEVKTRLITPALQQSGWNLTQLAMEKSVKCDYAFTDGAIEFASKRIQRGKPKRCDYLLSSFEGFPLAIIEAKDDSHSLYDGLQQAMDYAKALNTPFAYSSNGESFIEYDFLTGKQRQIAMDSFPSEQELLERYFQGKNITQSQRELIATHYYLEDKSPRYYQANAVNKTLEALTQGQKRILLVMATGTGKTFSAFQIIHRLFKAGKIKKILYLADRNNLIEQTKKNDFKFFGDKATIIKNKNFDSSYTLYFGIYQQFISIDSFGNVQEHFKDFDKNFFDFILVDECHRGSAKEDSAWRQILEYFSSAIQVGMTATPKHDDEASNLDYFGEPLYTYSLKQGIADGFLAPYKVIRYGINIDVMGYRPEDGKRDKAGNLIPDEEYQSSDFNRILYIDERTELVAKKVSDFLKYTLRDRYAKTIVFCQDTYHASVMRQALINENSDLMQENSNYIVRITGDDKVGKSLLEKFISEKEPYPVIATTSKLLTTGADTKMLKVIAIDSNINSLTEFKQIIGRGTRINQRLGKSYFSILDFKNTTRLFADKDFDGEILTELERDIKTKAQMKQTDTFDEESFPEQTPDINTNDTRLKKIEINGVEVAIVHELHQIVNSEGKLISNDFISFSRQNIHTNYQSLESFLNDWNANANKTKLLKKLEEKGILIQELRAMQQFQNLDEFDIILSLAFDQTPLSRSQRAKKANKILAKFTGKAKEVLEVLLEKYATNGIVDIENPDVFKTKPFDFIDVNQVTELFGGVENYIKALNELKTELYNNPAA